MRRRHENDVHVRRRDVGQYVAKSLHHAQRQHGQLLYDDERHDDDELQHDDGYVPIRYDQKRNDHDLYQRR